MSATSRVGQRNTGTRDKLLDATIEIMLDEGYAAATSRRVAEKAGVQRAMVYYYFPTMDDLYLAVLRRGYEANMEAQREALASEKPLHALWEMTVDPRGSRLTTEFMALGAHREPIREELAAGAEQFREAQVEALAEMVRDYAEGEGLHAEVVSVVLASIGRTIGLENGLGITTGHERTLKLVAEYLDRFDGPRPN
ncbi:TetR/AcrR family transcriptional regulator [Nocardia sp. 348MFTsu5.1]|uniref:TetR/AcrR family transcriptional regulator n=1 Tax=Nocardia sp. 348MFTsu5.1 TaxID=1172185 RepID=UPI00035C636D|nr:TetR/AcrR family transcriptional regulator [Nocardia sp. 348MFTsu5.1]